ncbi:hypothetical protein Hamer_G010387, partial [Homarus americanus]
NVCLFCYQPAKDTNSWYHASTFELDARVRKCALQLQDQHLLDKLSAGDLIVQKAKDLVQTKPDNTFINQGIALAELVSYIEDAHTDTKAVRVL